MTTAYRIAYLKFPKGSSELYSQSLLLHQDKARHLMTLGHTVNPDPDSGYSLQIRRFVFACLLHTAQDACQKSLSILLTAPLPHGPRSPPAGHVSSLKGVSQNPQQSTPLEALRPPHFQLFPGAVCGETHLRVLLRPHHHLCSNFMMP